MSDGSDIKRGRKFDQVLDGARDVFMREGFDGASVDDIARAAGVSKATLYSYFPDKRLLFMEVARTEFARQADLAVATFNVAQPAAQVLAEVAGHVFDFLTSDFGLAIYRICVGERNRFPDLGREFYESGPLIVHQRLIGYLKSAVADGELAIDDLTLAAEQFEVLCKADVFPRLLFRITERASPAEKRRVIDGAVATFMARYGR